MSRDNDQKGKDYPLLKCHVTMTKKYAWLGEKLQLQNHSLTFTNKNKSPFQLWAFCLVHFWLTTLLFPWTGQLVPTIWTLAKAKTGLDNFLVRKSFQQLGCKTQSFKKKLQQRNLTGTMSYSGRKRFRGVHAIAESAGHCSRKHWSRGELVSGADTNIVRRLGWTTQTGSQGFRHSGPSERKNLCNSAAVECGQEREILCSYPIVCQENGVWEVLTNCLCELRIWGNYTSTWCNDFFI